jgi:hypothetical protein
MQMMTEVFGLSRRVLLAGLVGIGATLGCTDAKMSSKPATQPTTVTQDTAKKPAAADEKPAAEKPAETDEVLAERKKLSAEDRKLVDAQEWCVISSDERLGGMGAPIKLSIKGETVFVCCKGCKKEAEANPDKTLAKVKELKAKKAAADKKS